jgi:peptide methionine sulfoxide reductase MsrA
MQTIILGGAFAKFESVFYFSVKGVQSVVSGYAGRGDAVSATITKMFVAER